MDDKVTFYPLGKLIIIGLSLNILNVLAGGLFTFTPPELIFSSTNVRNEVIFHDNFDPPGDPEPKKTSGAGSRYVEVPVKPLMYHSDSDELFFRSTFL